MGPHSDGRGGLGLVHRLSRRGLRGYNCRRGFERKVGMMSAPTVPCSMVKLMRASVLALVFVSRMGNVYAQNLQVNSEYSIDVSREICYDLLCSLSVTPSDCTFAGKPTETKCKDLCDDIPGCVALLWVLRDSDKPCYFASAATISHSSGCIVPRPNSDHKFFLRGKTLPPYTPSATTFEPSMSPTEELLATNEPTMFEPVPSVAPSFQPTAQTNVPTSATTSPTSTLLTTHPSNSPTVSDELVPSVAPSASPVQSESGMPSFSPTVPAPLLLDKTGISIDISREACYTRICSFTGECDFSGKPSEAKCKELCDDIAGCVATLFVTNTKTCYLSVAAEITTEGCVVDKPNNNHRFFIRGRTLPPTSVPTLAPTPVPTSTPSEPTSQPSFAPTTNAPSTMMPTQLPTSFPTDPQVTFRPSEAPSITTEMGSPVANPTTIPSGSPHTQAPFESSMPTNEPSAFPSTSPSFSPTVPAPLLLDKTGISIDISREACYTRICSFTGECDFSGKPSEAKCKELCDDIAGCVATLFVTNTKTCYLSVAAEITTEGCVVDTPNNKHRFFIRGRTLPPTSVPTLAPTPVPTSTPSEPTSLPSLQPSVAPSTRAPTSAPTVSPSTSTLGPTGAELTGEPSMAPSTRISSTPTELPTYAPTLNQPLSRSPTGHPTAGCRIISGGPTSAGSECQLPFFVGSTRYDSCAEVKQATSDFPDGFPYKWEDFSSINANDLWCLKRNAGTGSTYEYDNTGERYSWGLCECYTIEPTGSPITTLSPSTHWPSSTPSSAPVTLTGFPTMPSPSAPDPTPEPTSMPSSFPTTRFPTTGYPTTHAPVVEGSLEAVYHADDALQEATQRNKTAFQKWTADRNNPSLELDARKASEAVVMAKAEYDAALKQYHEAHFTSSPSSDTSSTRLQTNTADQPGADPAQDDSSGIKPWHVLVIVFASLAVVAVACYFVFKRKRRGRLRRPGYSAEQDMDVELQKNLDLGPHGGESYANPMGSNAPFATFVEQVRHNEKNGPALAVAYEALSPKTKLVGELCGAPYVLETHIRDGRRMVGQHKGTRTLQHLDGSVFKEQVTNIYVKGILTEPTFY